MLALTIKVYPDYVCPFCFLAEKPLQEAAEGKDVQIEWMPFELRPYPNETLRPEGEYLQTTWKQYVYPMRNKWEFRSCCREFRRSHTLILLLKDTNMQKKKEKQMNTITACLRRFSKKRRYR